MKISEKQFDYVYNEYAKELFNIAYGYTRNRDDSIDIMQNSYVTLLESNKTFESNEHIKYFLIRVTINESLDFLKSSYKNKVIKNNDFASNFPETKKEELPYDLSKIVNTLPEKYKTIIILHYYDDMRIKDISNILKISESAVKKRLERARRFIKETIERNYKND